MVEDCKCDTTTNGSCSEDGKVVPAAHGLPHALRGGEQNLQPSKMCLRDNRIVIHHMTFICNTRTDLFYLIQYVELHHILSCHVLSSQKRTELTQFSSCKRQNNASHNTTKNPTGFDGQQNASDYIFHSIKTKSYRYQKDQQFLVCEK
jgi:hypothetical protein